MADHSEKQPRSRPRRWRIALIVASLLLGGLVVPTVLAPPASAVEFTVALTLQPANIPTGTGQTTATVVVTYQGLARNNQQIYFTTTGDAHMPASCTTDANGRCSRTITAGTTYGSQTITATINNGGTLITGSDSKPLFQYAPATAVAVSFLNGVDRVAPNGTAQTTAIAAVTDAQGRSVPGQSVQFSTSAVSNKVTFGPTTHAGDGTYRATVTAPAIVVAATAPTTQTITATVATGPTSSGALRIGHPSFHTTGNAIYDDFNRRVTVEGGDGILTGWLATPRVPYDQNADNAVHMAAEPFRTTSGTMWGFNVVRLELSDAHWFSSIPYSTTDTRPCSTVYREKVADVVNQVTSRGMIALLDLHGVPAASTQASIPPSELACNEDTTGPGTPRLRPMADAAYAPSFWTQVATAYKDNPMVAFELYNEPSLHTGITNALGGDCSPDPKPATVPAGSGQTPVGVWHDGGTVNNGNLQYAVAGMQTLYNNVRATGATNLVVVGGVGPIQCQNAPSYDLRPIPSHPIVDPSTGQRAPNVVYSSHPYWGSNCATTSPLGTNGIPADMDDVVLPTAGQFPVIFSEFGTSCANGTQGANYNKAIIDYAVAHQLGWINYAFNRGDWATSYGVYQCDRSYTAGCQTTNKTYAYYEPMERGAPVLAQLQATPKPLS